MLPILYEDNHLLAIAKPAGLPTQGAAAGEESVVTWAKEYIRRKYHKPGNVYVGVVSRLDAPTSGVVVLARTSKGAARLSEQFRGRSVEKVYWAVVEGRLEPPTGELHDWLVKDEAHQRMVIGRANAAGAQEARLTYQRLQVSGDCSLIEIQLETGRKHQIRVQLAERGHPIIGDAKYGSKRKFAAGIALHCRRMVLEHPTLRTRIELATPPPESWQRFGFDLLST